MKTFLAKSSNLKLKFFTLLLIPLIISLFLSVLLNFLTNIDLIITIPISITFCFIYVLQKELNTIKKISFTNNREIIIETFLRKKTIFNGRNISKITFFINGTFQSQNKTTNYYTYRFHNHYGEYFDLKVENFLEDLGEIIKIIILFNPNVERDEIFNKSKQEITNYIKLKKREKSKIIQKKQIRNNNTNFQEDIKNLKEFKKNYKNVQHLLKNDDSFISKIIYFLLKLLEGKIKFFILIPFLIILLIFITFILSTFM